VIYSFIIFSSLYLGVCFYLSRGLKKIGVAKIAGAPESEKKTAAHKYVSVIVCARNEEENIGRLLECFLRQTYPADRTQVIVVNDRSSDKTPDIALSFRDRFGDFRLVNISDSQTEFAPKKFALEQGIRCAKGEIIAQTDADSVVAPDWLERLVAPFADDEISLVQGIVKYRFEKPAPFLLETYQKLDFFSHGIVAAAGIGRNMPLNSNANNWAFRKETYETLGGYGSFDKSVVGDDCFLVQKIWRSGKKIFFNADSFVQTRPEYSWRNLINQHKRWGSETRYYPPKQFAVLSVIFAFYCFTIIALVAIFVSRRDFALVPALFAAKILGELLFMYRGLSILGEKKFLPHIIWVSPINLFLTTFLILSGVFTKFHWKGGEFGARMTRKRKENL